MSSAENLKEIKKLLIGLSAYFQVNLSDIQIAMYAEDLGHLSAQVVGDLIMKWRRNPKHGRFPLPGQLIASGSPSPERIAPIVTLKLIGAVRTHGEQWAQNNFGRPRFYRHGSFEADFKAELGEHAEVAAQIVKDAGGWIRFCKGYWEAGNPTAFTAQLREVAKSYVEQPSAVSALPDLSKHSQIGNDTNLLNFFSEGA